MTTSSRIPAVNGLLLLLSMVFLVLTGSVLGVGLGQPEASRYTSGWVEKRLIKKLLEDYDKRTRPVLDGVTPEARIRDEEWVQQLTVEFGLELIQILDLNEMDQVLTTSVRTLYRWMDYHLRWSPADFDNLTFVNIPPPMIWLPDVVLYNYADERMEEKRESDVRVYNDGTVMWQPMAIYKSTCPVRIRHFPFDKQGCRLKFGVWSFDGYRVNITFFDKRQNLSLTNYIPSPEWDILDSSAVFTETRYPCCPETYPDISFYVWIARRPAFYNYILILPCFLLSSLTLVLFWLPPETPAKMVLGMNIFVAFFLLLLLLEDTTPSASSSFPLLGTYYCLNMGIITLSSFLSCLIVNFHFRGDSRQEVPQWLKKLAILYGSRLLWVNVGDLRKLMDNSKGLQLMTSDVRRLQASSFMKDSSAPRLAARPNAFRTTSTAGYAAGVKQRSTETPQTLHHRSRLLTAPPSRPTRRNLVQPMASPQLGSSQQHNSSSTPRIVINPHTEDNDEAMSLDQTDDSSCLNQQDFPDEIFANNEILKETPIRPSCFAQPVQVDRDFRQQSPAPSFDGRTSTFSPFQADFEYIDADSDEVEENMEDIQHTEFLSESTPHRDLPTSATQTSNTSNTKVEQLLYVERMCEDVNDIMKGLRYLQRIHDNKDRLQQIFSEWRAVGMVLDRFFFLCYFCIILLSILFIFTQTDHQVRVGDHMSVLEPTA